MKQFISFFIATLIITSCMPNVLNKYRRGSMDQPQASTEPQPASLATDSTSLRSVQSNRPQSIVAINDRTFRFNLSDTDVWDGALNVLLQNYALTIIDKDSGIITTEWDSYFADRAVFRNKVSMRIRKLNYKSVEVTIHNSQERLQDASQAGSVGAIWLPAKDDGRETGRIVRNMAVALGQAVPQLPGNLAAADVLSDRPEPQAQ